MFSHVWTGGFGVWSNLHNWRLPNILLVGPPTYWIDGGNGQESLVMLDVNASVGGVMVDVGDQLLFQPGNSLMLNATAGGFVNNHGLVQLQAQNEIRISGVEPVSFNGNGIIQLTNSQTSRIVAMGMSAVLTNNGNTIEGAGMIGDGTLQFTNVGVVDANLPLDVLTVRPGPSPVVNQGIMQASNGGELRLQSGVIINDQAQIVAQDHSYIDLIDLTVNGGTLAAEGDGVVRTYSGSATLKDLTLDADYEIGVVRLTLLGTINNLGLIDAVGNNAIVPTDFTEIAIPQGDVSLNGSGELRMGWTKIYSGSGPNGGRLINGANHTISGQGLLGYNTIRLTNHGTIIADGEYPIAIDPIDNQLVVNDGVLRAHGAGGIVLGGGIYRNDGIIEVLPGSKFIYTANAIESNISNSTLTGGTWRVIGEDLGALLLIPGPSVFYNNADVTLNGTGSTFQLINTLAVNINRFALENGRTFTTQSTFFTNQGELSISGNSSLVVNGSFTQQPSAEMLIELEPAGSEESPPSIQVNGPATIGGELRITVGKSSHLTVGSTYNILTSSSIVGNFAKVNLPAGVEIEIVGNAIRAVVVSICVGDLDASGTVDASDLLALYSQWGYCQPRPQSCAADFNGDHMVDAADLLILLEHWGDGCQSH